MDLQTRVELGKQLEDMRTLMMRRITSEEGRELALAMIRAFETLLDGRPLTSPALRHHP